MSKIDKLAKIISDKINIEKLLTNCSKEFLNHLENEIKIAKFCKDVKDFLSIDLKTFDDKIITYLSRFYKKHKEDFNSEEAQRDFINIIKNPSTYETIKNNFLDFFRNYLKDNQTTEIRKKGFEKTLVKMNEKIVIKKFIFNNYDYSCILSKIEKLELEECTFYDDFNFIENKTYHFNNCIFENDLTISNCQTFENESLFFDCEFKRVKINSETINIELFDNCRIEILNAYHCIFNKKIINDSFSKSQGIKYGMIYFVNCTIKENFYILITNRLNFSSCIFEKNVSLSLHSKVKDITISFCNFNDNLILNAPKIESLRIEKTIFLGNVDLGRSIVEKFELISSNFSKNCNFYDTKFIKTNDFKFTTFNQSVNFSKAKFNNINFSDTNFLSFVDFSEISNIENKQIECEKIENRKTARVLKSKLDEANNIIESNYFYSIEMKKREEELEKDIKNGKNFFEWLVFKIHGISSNHSQDWLLPIFWILNITFSLFITEKSIELFGFNLIAFIPLISMIILGITIAIINYHTRRTILLFILSFINFGIFKIISEKHSLDCVSDKINPFSIMTELSKLDFSTMIYKITIAYLIYQLIISIRQNTRRK